MLRDWKYPTESNGLGFGSCLSRRAWAPVPRGSGAAEAWPPPQQPLQREGLAGAQVREQSRDMGQRGPRSLQAPRPPRDAPHGGQRVRGARGNPTGPPRPCSSECPRRTQRPATVSSPAPDPEPQTLTPHPRPRAQGRPEPTPDPAPQTLTPHPRLRARSRPTPLQILRPRP